MTERITPDVTYQGLLLTKSAYKAHLIMLSAYREGRSVDSIKFPLGITERDVDQAKMAIHLAGFVRCPSCSSGQAASLPFHWCQYRLTEYGEIYAKQRGA